MIYGGDTEIQKFIAPIERIEIKRENDSSNKHEMEYKTLKKYKNF